MAEAAPPPEVLALAEERAAARAAKDFDRADALRAQIEAAGWTVVDEAGGYRLEPGASAPAAPALVRAQEVESVLDQPATCDVSVHWVVEGWPEDVVRALAAFRTSAQAVGISVQYVVADLTGSDPAVYGDDVEVVRLEGGCGWGAARNAGLKRSLGRFAFLMDGSIEPAGEVFSPLMEALNDPGVGLCGPFGIVTQDLREFDEAPGVGDCDAIEGYFMALRRETLSRELFDEKFKWYRTADIEYSFRLKDAGLRTVVVPVPVVKHEHRMWFETTPEERAKWSKRNYYRFLDRWRDRWDLVLSGEPPADEHGVHDKHDEHHHHD
jgi:cysteinyl-tRNA synthetase